jgi:hypothetical protein
MENGFFIVDNDGVAGVIAALKTDDHVYTVAEQIDDFSFAFVSPLGTYDYISCHIGLL